jgi:phosphatidylserine/phosphatidylglycerophosphate/cardiolipin synthase-like enzyme
VTDLLSDLTGLDQYAAGGFAADWAPGYRVFYSPIDDVHSVLKDCLTAAKQSVALTMYGFDDDELADIIRQKLEDPAISVQLTLDSSQAGGVHERTLLAKEGYPASVVAVGRSEKGAIMHQKILVVDGILSVTGSTNWSTQGESKQDNECSVHLDRAFAAKARARADAIHAHMLAASK